jgi:hypothetical protein
MDQIFGPNFLDAVFRGKRFVSMTDKMNWATFWAIFSQTHLVTLVLSYIKEIVY